MRRLVAMWAIVFAITQSGPCAAQSVVPKHTRKFVRLNDCEFVSTEYADGDSFCVRSSAGEFVFRLYYVDAPEPDERFPDRNADQAHYFGITPAENLAVGKAAARFVRETLTGRKFSVFTRWSSALGSSRLPRFYAVIDVDGRGLADLLVEKGWARLHGVSVNNPDGRKAPEYIATLQELEQAAKAQKLGGWENSQPNLQNADVVETPEVPGPSPWVERIGFAGGGAAIAVIAWVLSKRRNRSPKN